MCEVCWSYIFAVVLFFLQEAQFHIVVFNVWYIINTVIIILQYLYFIKLICIYDSYIKLPFFIYPKTSISVSIVTQDSPELYHSQKSINCQVRVIHFIHTLAGW